MYKIIEDYLRVEFSCMKSHCFLTGDVIKPLEFVCNKEIISRLKQILIGHLDVVYLSDEIMREKLQDIYYV